MATPNAYATLSVELAMTDGAKKKISITPIKPSSYAVTNFKSQVMQFNAYTDTSTRPTIIGTTATNQLKTGHTYPNDCPIVSATIENVVKTPIYQSETANLYAKKEGEE